jgi:hypothetical protein
VKFVDDLISLLLLAFRPSLAVVALAKSAGRSLLYCRKTGEILCGKVVRDRTQHPR